MKLHFPIPSGMKVAALGTLVFGVGLIAFRAQADQWDKMTVLTVNEPIQVSDTYLDPGTYVLKLVDIGSARNVVRIMNADQSRLINTMIAMPNYRLKPTGDSRFIFYETPPGSARAMRAWFYPGDDYGQEFRYPKSLRQLAVAKPAPALQAFEPAPPAPPVQTPSIAPQAPPVQTEVQQPVETQAPIEVAQNTPPPPPPVVQPAPTSAEPAAPPTELPKTATLFPLAGLGGLASLLLYGLIRVVKA